MKTTSLLALSLLSCMALPVTAQKNGAKAQKSGTEETAQSGKANNMMLNATDETSPRFINVGLPEGTGGTVVSENGMLISPDTYLLMPNQGWRQDGSFMKPESWLRLLSNWVQWAFLWQLRHAGEVISSSVISIFTPTLSV